MFVSVSTPSSDKADGELKVVTPFHLTRQGFKCWPVSAATLLQGSFRSSQAEPVQLLREIGEPKHDFKESEA